MGGRCRGGGRYATATLDGRACGAIWQCCRSQRGWRDRLRQGLRESLSCGLLGAGRRGRLRRGGLRRCVQTRGGAVRAEQAGEAGTAALVLRTCACGCNCGHGGGWLDQWLWQPVAPARSRRWRSARRAGQQVAGQIATLVNDADASRHCGKCARQKLPPGTECRVEGAGDGGHPVRGAACVAGALAGTLHAELHGRYAAA